MATPPNTPPAANEESLTLLKLSNELSSVSEWYLLGVHLGVNPDQLETIKTSSVSGDQKRAEMLHVWLKNSLGASWQDVVTALKSTREVRLAEAIEKKYPTSPGLTPPISSITFDIPLTEVPESVEQIEVTRNNLAEIRGKFGALLEFACTKLQEKLTKEEVKGKFFMFLLTIFSVAKQYIPKSSDLEDIFEAITSHDLWNYWNYYPLEQIIMKYGDDDPDMMERMENYKRDLSGFQLVTKIKNYIPAVKAHLTESDEELEASPVDRTPKYFKRLSIKWNQRVNEYSLRYIDNVWQSLSSRLLLPPPSVLLEAVLEKSVLVVWLIPVDLVPKAIEKARQSTKFFQIYPILEVVIDGECVYEGGESTAEEDMERIMEHSRSIKDENLLGLTLKQRSKMKTVKHRWWRAVLLAPLLVFLAVFISARVPAGQPATEQTPNDRVQRSTSYNPDNILPIHTTMPQFSKYKRESTNWYSEPFYTHLRGYKLVLNVDADGHGRGEGTHISIFLHLVRGEFDYKLEWPFQGTIIIQLLNQIENKMHHEKAVHFTADRGGRVTEGEIAAIGWGLDFILHQELSYNPYRNSYYSKDDTLLFRVELQMAVLPVQIAMTDFERHKKDKDLWYSKPFYTHQGGYKMNLQVDANGNGTHVFVYISLARGTFNNNLRWPFQGDVTVKLLNQVEDVNHYKQTIQFTSYVTPEEAGRNFKGWGGAFIPHNLLSQYLKDGSLQFHITCNNYDADLINVLPVQIAMTDFKRYKKYSIKWFSEPFYTHQRGYKLCLLVFANGDGAGRGTHISVYRCLMQGEYDNQLEWPFFSDISVQLLNQSEDTTCCESTFTSVVTPSGRVTEGGINLSECIGTSQFIAHHRLKDDTLLFRVMLKNTTCILPCEVTMTDFERHKEDNDWWFSEPFYVHQGGYKMYLQVYDYSSGNVSVYIGLARGKSDGNLRWRGDVTVKLINQVEDRNHYKETIRITSFNTPVEVARGNSQSWGRRIIIPHNLLSHYLKNDSLQFHVSCNNCGADLSDENMTNVLPIQVAMTDFDRYRRDTEVWFSEPFYTHPEGYKLYLKVYANGHNTGNNTLGTHISIYRCLMQGKNDDRLEWPFYSDIIIQLLNQNEDILYAEKMLISTAGHPRVTKKVAEQECVGLPQFIPHHQLRHLKEGLDTIIIRATLWNTTSTLPCQFTMTDFERHKKDNDWWISEPFYSHQEGYKMYLQVYANGSGTHVLVYINLGIGKFDSNLEWPFQGGVTVRLLNQVEDRNHYEQTIDFMDENAISFEGWGIEFISHDLLNSNSQYIKDDSLQFHLSDATMMNVVPLQITMADFERHKRDSEMWFSEPFYTHPGGDKLHLKVYANGEDTGKGTHVSIYHCLLQGVRRDRFRTKWSFINDTTILLLNQIDNTTYRMSSSHPNTVIATTDKATNSCRGYPLFIPHHDLDAYMNDDTLVFGVEAYVLPIQVTMADFEDHKKARDVWYSESFYTHPGGYRMSIIIYAAGYQRGRRTHVSVYVTLERGKFDYGLKWPFQGNIILKLLNHKVDVEYYERTIHCDDKTIYYTGRERRYARWGIHKFISHSYLDNNRQYWKDGGLQFNVTYMYNTIV